MKFRVGHLSIIGKRDNNEDAYFIDDPFHRFFLVADGMGGQSAGEKASSLAMEIIPRKLRHLDFEKATAEQTIQTINDAVSEANIEIMAGGEVNSKLKNMGTTLVFVVRVVETLFVGGVGDSRVYLLRAGTLQQLRRTDGACGQDHFRGGVHLAAFPALDIFHADGAPAFEQHAAGGRRFQGHHQSRQRALA